MNLILSTTLQINYFRTRLVISFQNSTTFEIGERNNFISYYMCIMLAEPLVPGPSPLEFEIAIENLKTIRFPSSKQISA
jgi:hypothetical protein